MSEPLLPALPRRHEWQMRGVKRLSGVEGEFPDGNDRTFRACSQCGLIKVTVHAAHGKDAWREWRSKDGEFLRRGGPTPPCGGQA